MFILSKQDLESAYIGGLSMAEIAQREHVSLNTVAYWMKKYNIPRRTWSEATYVKSNPDGDPYKIKQLITQIATANHCQLSSFSFKMINAKTVVIIGQIKYANDADCKLTWLTAYINKNQLKTNKNPPAAVSKSVFRFFFLEKD